MRKRIISLTLLSLLLIGCNEVTDPVMNADGTNGNAVGNNTRAEEEKKGQTADTNALFTEFKAGVTAFYQSDSDMTYEYTEKGTGEDSEDRTEQTVTAKGTYKASDGFFFEKYNSVDKDLVAKTEDRYGSEWYCGLISDEYRFLSGQSVDEGEKTRKSSIADRHVAKYYMESRVFEDYDIEDMCEYTVNSKNFDTLGAIIKYADPDLANATDYKYDIAKTDEGVVFSCSGNLFYYECDYYYEESKEYSLTVKNGFLTGYHYSMTEFSVTPSGVKESESTTLDIAFKNTFDETFYQSITDIASYPEPSDNVPIPVDVYYGDYYVLNVYGLCGGDIQVGDTRIDGLYYDKECTIPSTSKKYTSDVRKMYCKLKATAGTDNAYCFTMNEITYLYYGIDYPSEVDKYMALFTATSTTFRLPWKFSGTKQEKALEKMYVNGVETTETTLDVTFGNVYFIKHTFSTYTLRG